VLLLPGKDVDLLLLDHLLLFLVFLVGGLLLVLPMVVAM
jgi:hypothetical protein